MYKIRLFIMVFLFAHHFVAVCATVNYQLVSLVGSDVHASQVAARGGEQGQRITGKFCNAMGVQKYTISSPKAKHLVAFSIGMGLLLYSAWGIEGWLHGRNERVYANGRYVFLDSSQSILSLFKYGCALCFGVFILDRASDMYNRESRLH